MRDIFDSEGGRSRSSRSFIRSISLPTLSCTRRNLEVEDGCGCVGDGMGVSMSIGMELDDMDSFTDIIHLRRSLRPNPARSTSTSTSRRCTHTHSWLSWLKLWDTTTTRVQRNVLSCLRVTWLWALGYGVSCLVLGPVVYPGTRIGNVGVVWTVSWLGSRLGTGVAVCVGGGDGDGDGDQAHVGSCWGALVAGLVLGRWVSVPRPRPLGLVVPLVDDQWTFTIQFIGLVLLVTKGGLELEGSHSSHCRRSSGGGLRSHAHPRQRSGVWERLWPWMAESAAVTLALRFGFDVSLWDAVPVGLVTALSEDGEDPSWGSSCLVGVLVGLCVFSTGSPCDSDSDYHSDNHNPSESCPWSVWHGPRGLLFGGVAGILGGLMASCRLWGPEGGWDNYDAHTHTHLTRTAVTLGVAAFQLFGLARFQYPAAGLWSVLVTAVTVTYVWKAPYLHNPATTHTWTRLRRRFRALGNGWVGPRSYDHASHVHQTVTRCLRSEGGVEPLLMGLLGTRLFSSSPAEPPSPWPWPSLLLVGLAWGVRVTVAVGSTRHSSRALPDRFVRAVGQYKGPLSAALCGLLQRDRDHDRLVLTTVALFGLVTLPLSVLLPSLWRRCVRDPWGCHTDHRSTSTDTSLPVEVLAVPPPTVPTNSEGRSVEGLE